MKKLFLFLLMLSFSTALIFTGCDTRDDDMEDRMEEIDETRVEQDRKVFFVRDREYTYNDRDQYRIDLREAQREIDREIERLEARAANAEDDAKEEYNEAIEDLRERRNDLDNRLERLGKVTEEEWNEFRSDVSSWFDDLEREYNEVLRKMRTDDDRY